MYKDMAGEKWRMSYLPVSKITILNGRSSILELILDENQNLNFVNLYFMKGKISLYPGFRLS